MGGNAGAHGPPAAGARMTLGCWEQGVGVTGSGSGVCLNLLKTGIWSERRVSQVVREETTVALGSLPTQERGSSAVGRAVGVALGQREAPVGYKPFDLGNSG